MTLEKYPLLVMYHQTMGRAARCDEEKARQIMNEQAAVTAKLGEPR